MVMFASLHYGVFCFCAVPCVVRLVIILGHRGATQPLGPVGLHDAVSALLASLALNIPLLLLALPGLLFSKSLENEVLQSRDGYLTQFYISGGTAEVAFRFALVLAHVPFTVWCWRSSERREQPKRGQPGGQAEVQSGSDGRRVGPAT